MKNDLCKKSKTYRHKTKILGKKKRELLDSVTA